MANHKIYVNGTDNSGAWMFTTLENAITFMAANYDNLTDDNGSGGAGVLDIEISITGADDNLNVNGFTTDASNYINIYTTAAARHSGVWSDSKYRIVASNVSAVLGINDNHVRVAGVQVKLSSSSAAEQTGIQIVGQDAAAIIHLDSCIVQTPHAGTHGLYGVYVGDADVTLHMWNCIVDEGSESGASYSAALSLQAAATANVYNCTLIGDAYGISDLGSATVTIKNTYCYGATGGTQNVNTSSYSASSSAELGGTGDVDNVALDTTNFESVTRGNASYLMPKSGGALVAAGNAPGGAAPLNYTVDIAGTTVSTWDIGAFNYADAVAQYARPASTVAAGNWDGFIAGVDQNDSSNLDNYIDETTADDNDSIRSGTSPSDDSCTIGLSEIQTPAAGTVTMRIRARFL